MDVAASASRIMIWIPIAVEREPGKVGISVITEETLRISMRIKELRRPVIAIILPCGLVLLVKLPQTQPYRAQEQEGITRASEERVWMAETTRREPTECLELRHVYAPMVGMVILVTRLKTLQCHARNRTRAAMVVRVWMDSLIHHPTVAMVNGIASALTVPPVYYANLAMLTRATEMEERKMTALPTAPASAMLALSAGFANIPMFTPAIVVEKCKKTAPASATPMLEETTASTAIL